MRCHILLLCAAMVLLLNDPAGAAAVEGRVLQSLRLPEGTRQVVLSNDGQRIFALGQGNVSVYTIQGQLLGELNVPEDVSGIEAHSQSLLLLVREGGEFIDYLLVEVIQEIDISAAPILGPEEAPVTIAVFDDFQCPYCAQLAPELTKLRQLYPQQVKLAFKNFPLGQHAYARRAAQAALAAERQGKFWEFYDRLFVNHNRLDDAQVEKIAAELQLDLERFRQDWRDPALDARIEQDLAEARHLDLRGTPAVFINGRLFQDRSPNGLRRAIEAELERTQSAAGGEK